MTTSLEGSGIPSREVAVAAVINSKKIHFKKMCQVLTKSHTYRGALLRPRAATPRPPMLTVMWPRIGLPLVLPPMAGPLAGPPLRGACCMGTGVASCVLCWPPGRAGLRSGASPFSCRTGSSNAAGDECKSACIHQEHIESRRLMLVLDSGPMRSKVAAAVNTRSMHQDTCIIP